MLVITNKTLTDRGIMLTGGEKPKIVMIPALSSYSVPSDMEAAVSAYMQTETMQRLLDAKVFVVGKRETRVVSPTELEKVKPPRELSPLPEDTPGAPTGVRQKSPTVMAKVAV